MKVTEQLHQLGQSLWLDNITRGLLTSGTLERYISDFSITGLTSNPSIFDRAIRDTTFYDDAIRGLAEPAEKLFFELAIEDLSKAADLFLPIYEATGGRDGWVSLEVSPLLAYDTKSTLAAAKDLHGRAGQPNLFIKIPGTKEGLPAIEEAIFAGVPINVTLLFSREQYVAAAEAFLRGIDSGRFEHAAKSLGREVHRAQPAYSRELLRDPLGLLLVRQMTQSRQPAYFRLGQALLHGHRFRGRHRAVVLSHQ